MFAKIHSWDLDVCVNMNTLRGTEVPKKQVSAVMFVPHLNFKSVPFITEISMFFCPESSFTTQPKYYRDSLNLSIKTNKKKKLI